MESNSRYIQELEENKQKLKELVSRLEGTIDDVEKILPKKYDYKTRYIIIDRTEVLTKLYDTILKYRSEIAKQIKEQANLDKTEEVNEDEARDAIIGLPLQELKKLLKEDD